jgi:hypothetical protein
MTKNVVLMAHDNMKKILALAVTVALSGSVPTFSGTASINEPGTYMQLWDCHGDSNQRWYF